MKYVISDIHGMYDLFIEMLELIKFSDDDELYILGDVIDRGPEPLKIIDYIVSKKNIHLIKGNHEDMFLEYVNHPYYGWLQNGGDITYQKIIERGEGYKENLYNYIKGLPYIKVIDKFILVHAGLYFPDYIDEFTSIDELLAEQEEDHCLWNRSNVKKELSFMDYTVICGHTPVQTIDINYDDARILHKKGHIYIDCGCCFEEEGCKLACLCLDTMEEFYVNSTKKGKDS